MTDSTLVYSTGLPVVRPTGRPSHRGTSQAERDRIEYRPMPMPTVRKPRASAPWHGAERDPSGGRHRVTRSHDSACVLDLASSVLDDALALLGGAA